MRIREGRVGLTILDSMGLPDESPSWCQRPDKVSIGCSTDDPLVSKHIIFIQMVRRGLVGSWVGCNLKELKCALGRKDLGHLEAKTLRARG